MIPQWIIFAALGGLSSNIFNFFNRYILKEEGDSSSWAFTFELLRMLAFIIFSFFDFSIKLEPIGILMLLGVGITEFISVYLYMKMHSYSHLSISTIISRTRLLWIPVIAFLFLGEQLHLMEYLGIILLFLGISITVTPNKLFVDKGAIYANLAAFVIAINTIFLKLATPFASTSVVMIFFCLPSVMLFPIFMKNPKKRILGDIKKDFVPKIIGILANIVSSYFIIWALRIGDVSKVNGIYQGMLFVSVLAGIIILKEKQNIFKKLLGTAVTVLGVILLT